MKRFLGALLVICCIGPASAWYVNGRYVPNPPVTMTDVVNQTNGLANGILPAPYRAFQYYDWYEHGSVAGCPSCPPPSQFPPPSGYTAVELWGQTYWEKDTNWVPNCHVFVKASALWVHLTAGGWVQVQVDTNPIYDIYGGHYPADFDFANNPGLDMTVTKLADGSFMMDCPPVIGSGDHLDPNTEFAYNNHYYPQTRGDITGLSVDGAFMLMMVKTDNPNANLVFGSGIDWWMDLFAPPPNPGAGGSNWKRMTTDWQYNFVTGFTQSELMADPPPPLQ